MASVARFFCKCFGLWRGEVDNFNKRVIAENSPCAEIFDSISSNSPIVLELCQLMIRNDEWWWKWIAREFVPYLLLSLSASVAILTAKKMSTNVTILFLQVSSKKADYPTPDNNTTWRDMEMVVCTSVLLKSKPTQFLVFKMFQTF